MIGVIQTIRLISVKYQINFFIMDSQPLDLMFKLNFLHVFEILAIKYIQSD